MIIERIRKFFIYHDEGNRRFDFVTNKKEKIQYVLDRMVDVDIGVLREFLEMYLGQTEKESGGVGAGGSDYPSFEN